MLFIVKKESSNIEQCEKDKNHPKSHHSETMNNIFVNKRDGRRDNCGYQLSPVSRALCELTVNNKCETINLILQANSQKGK